MTEKTTSELLDRVELLVRELRPLRCCIACAYFREADEFCEVAQCRPPARVIAFGCPAYADAPPF